MLLCWISMLFKLDINVVVLDVNAIVPDNNVYWSGY